MNKHFEILTGEVWLAYPRLPKRFMVSNLGRILSLHTGKLLQTSLDRYGYERVSIIIGSRTNRSRTHLNLKIHQMVAETFYKRPTGNEWTVNHKDLNKLNNSWENLEWCTFSENTSHAWDMGVYRARKFGI